MAIFVITSMIVQSSNASAVFDDLRQKGDRFMARSVAVYMLLLMLLLINAVRAQELTIITEDYHMRLSDQQRTDR